MSADSLYDNFRSYLRLTARVTEKTGKNINVGETFTVRFTGSNTAYAANLVDKPRIVFDNTRIYVEGTQYARPVNGNGWHDLPDTELFPGEASFVEIEFEAIDDLGFWADIFGTEKIATAWIRADLDQNRYFEIWNKKNIKEEIDET